MKNFRLSALLCCVSLCAVSPPVRTTRPTISRNRRPIRSRSSNRAIPASIPGEGGGINAFVIRTETRSTGATFEPWAYRLTLGDAVGDAVTVSKPTTEIAITIPPNRSKEERGVAVEMASGVKAETWTKIVEATQEGSLKDYQVTKFEVDDYSGDGFTGGGDYDVLFRLEVETRAAAPLFVAWQYRVTLGDAVGDAVEVTEPTEKIGIHIDASESVEERAVIVEMAEVAETPVWTKIVEAKQEAGRKEYEVTEFESTTIPASVPFAGGDYEVKFRTKIETRATPQFEPWQYRLTVGEAVGEPVAVNEPTESVAVHIGANYSEKEVDVIFETAAASQTPVWTKVVEAKQQAGMELLGGFYWTKSNVSVKNDRFVLADKPSDSGLFFRHESGYGVPSDEATYAGTAYTPAPVQIAIDAIPQNEGVDPCSLIDPALRMPTYAELSELYYGEDVQRTQDGVTGMGYTGVSLFLPYCGVMSTETGTSVGKSTFGGYWGLGGDFHGNGVIYSLNGEIGYSLLDYDAVGTNMAMVRCVRNVPQPKYVMHTLPETVDYKAFSLNVETDPGAFTYYDVTVWGDDGTLTQTGATDARPQVSVGIPKNDTKQDRTLRLFVNHIYTGVEFVQPAMTDYALYVSHTPASAEYGAFTLSVTCDSDMASFPVVVKGSDGGEWSGTGSKENPTVEIAIPENTGEERTLSIWVNGVDTKKTVKQGKQVVPLVYSVVWSEGYLTVRDGAYVFAAPKERGMYFKYKSQYGFALPDPLESKPKYGGVVYGPTATEMAYADIPYGDTDPCSLVAPAGTWRMPTADELIELTSEGSKEFVVDTLPVVQRRRAGCLPRTERTEYGIIPDASHSLADVVVGRGRCREGPLSGVVEYRDQQAYGFQRRYEPGQFDDGTLRPCEITLRPAIIEICPEYSGHISFCGFVFSRVVGSGTSSSQRGTAFRIGLLRVPMSDAEPRLSVRLRIRRRSARRFGSQRMEFIRMLALTSASARMRAISTSLSAWWGFWLTSFT